MSLQLNSSNINEFGRYDDLKKTVDKAKAKAYFEKVEGTRIIPPKVNVKVDNLLRDFILNGGFEIETADDSNQNQQKYERVKGYFLGSFSVSWEQRKLGELGKARSGVGFPDSEQGGTNGVPFFKVSDMNLDGNENEMTVANNYVTPQQLAAHRWTPIEELPAIFFAKVGAAVMLNRKRLCRFPFLLDNNTMAYSLDSEKWYADFAKALFETVDLTSLVQIGALPSYNAGDVEAMEVCTPRLSEQMQIGVFFKYLDNLITLHQRNAKKEVLLLVNKAIPLIINSYHLALFAILIISSSATTSGSYSKTKLASGL